ncbi:MAG: hypothetical protein GXP34_14640 [Actinobacteria bacterium]|nr:hypothetical protein [Actinomycetota bacterium]
MKVVTVLGLVLSMPVADRLDEIISGRRLREPVVIAVVVTSLLVLIGVIVW